MPTGWKPNQPFARFWTVWCDTVGWSGVIRFMLHFHTYVHATLLFSSTSIHTFMLRCCHFSCTFVDVTLAWGGVVAWSGVGKTQRATTWASSRPRLSWRAKSEEKKWLPLGSWENLTQNGRPKFKEKTFSASEEIVQKWWFLWVEMKSQKNI